MTSAAPAIARKTRARGKEEGRQPKERDRGSPGDHGQDDAPADLPDPVQGAGEGDPDEGPDGRRGIEEPEANRPDPEDVEGEDREERRRHPEDHRVEVDGERRKDEAPAADEPETLLDRRQARLWRPAEGRIGRNRASIAGKTRSSRHRPRTPPAAPTLPMRIPAMIGPRTAPPLKVSWPREIAARRRCGRHEPGDGR